MEAALLYFVISVVFFTTLVLITSKERRLGRRLFASGFRSWLDMVLGFVYDAISKRARNFYRYILQLHWYYGMHAILKNILRVIVAAYTGMESLFERNRRQAKRLRAEKRHQNELNHLTQMSAHKAETALTPAQQKKLRAKQLEGKY